jgi:alpha-aminoadipate carrier protein LysW
VDTSKKIKTVTADCPDCGRKITLRGTLVIGQEVICPHCEAELEVIDTDPVELDWAYGESDDEWEDDEDEEEEEEEEEEDW